MVFCPDCERFVEAERKDGCSLGVGKIGWVDYCPDCDNGLNAAL